MTSLKKKLKKALAGVLSVTMVAGCAGVLTAPPETAKAAEKKSANSARAASGTLSDADVAALAGKDTNFSRVAVHDPSIIKSETSNEYYLYGSHLGVAKSGDLQNWSEAPTNGEIETTALFGKRDANGNVTKVSFKEAFDTAGYTNVEITLPSGEKKTVDFSQYPSKDWISPNELQGNFWAPDVIYNKAMKKYCMYMSLNGPNRNSVVTLLTSDKIEGPYVYEAPIVYSGPTTSTYAKTDMPLLLGDKFPGRYGSGNAGNRWPHCIDPCVFYDDDGELWMVYGSWSGGIYSLKLDEATGLRDYSVDYGINFDGDTYYNEPYYGKKIAGGYYQSGEGPYIQKIGKWYYLFISYGFYSPIGGYCMRVFRSKNPDGPYVDGAGNSAIYTEAVDDNFKTYSRGMSLMGNYKWDDMAMGEVAQGHNSAYVDENGNAYVIYHTKFDNGTVWHEVRVHQLFTNADGWLVAGPHEYAGETVNDGDLAKTALTAKDVVGNYGLIEHNYLNPNANQGKTEVAADNDALGLTETDAGKASVKKHVDISTEQKIQLSAKSDDALSGGISGAKSGSWKIDEGTSYVTVTIDGQTYKGVFVEQTKDGAKKMCFTAVDDTTGKCVWGSSESSDDYAVAADAKAYNLIPSYTSVDLTLGTEADWGSEIIYSSSNGNVVTFDGMVYRTGADQKATLTKTVRKRESSYIKEYPITVIGTNADNANKDVWTRYDSAKKGDYLMAVSSVSQDKGVRLVFKPSGVADANTPVFQTKTGRALYLSPAGMADGTGYEAEISCNYDGSIAFYRNGDLVKKYGKDDVVADNAKASDIVSDVIAAVKQGTISASCTMTDIRVAPAREQKPVVVATEEPTATKAPIKTVGTNNGDGTYTLAWDDYNSFHSTKVSGDFGLQYRFHTSSSGAEMWNTFAVALREKSSENGLYLRPDYRNYVFAGQDGPDDAKSQLGWTLDNSYYKIENNFDNLFAQSMKDADVYMTVTRTGSVMVVRANMQCSNGSAYYYKAVSKKAPTADMNIYLGGDGCQIDIYDFQKFDNKELGNSDCTIDSLPWWNYANFYGAELPAGDFKAEFDFRNQSSGRSNYENYAVAFTEDLSRGNQLAEDWYIRADNWCNSEFAGSSVEKKGNLFDAGKDFINSIKDANVHATVAREGTDLTVDFDIQCSDGTSFTSTYKSSGSPTTALKMYIGGQDCHLTILGARLPEKTLAVKYVNEDGKELASPVEVKMAVGSRYAIPSPALGANVPDTTVVRGVMLDKSKEVKVTYTTREDVTWIGSAGTDGLWNDTYTGPADGYQAGHKIELPQGDFNNIQVTFSASSQRASLWHNYRVVFDKGAETYWDLRCDIWSNTVPDGGEINYNSVDGEGINWEAMKTDTEYTLTFTRVGTTITVLVVAKGTVTGKPEKFRHTITASNMTADALTMYIASDTCRAVVYGDRLVAPEHTLTVNYVNADGEFLRKSSVDSYKEGANYQVSSPIIPGYIVEKDADRTVTGTMGTSNKTVNVRYTKLIATVGSELANGSFAGISWNSIKDFYGFDVTGDFYTTITFKNKTPGDPVWDTFCTDITTNMDKNDLPAWQKYGKDVSSNGAWVTEAEAEDHLHLRGDAWYSGAFSSNQKATDPVYDAANWSDDKVADFMSKYKNATITLTVSRENGRTITQVVDALSSDGKNYKYTVTADTGEAGNKDMRIYLGASNSYAGIYDIQSYRTVNAGTNVKLGSTVDASVANPEKRGMTYQWYRSGTKITKDNFGSLLDGSLTGVEKIAGATGSTYTFGPEDVGKQYYAAIVSWAGNNGTTVRTVAGISLSAPVEGGQEITIKNVSAEKVYDGTKDVDPSSVIVSFNNVFSDDNEYDVTASYEDANAGTGKKLTGTVTLKGVSAKAYKLVDATFTSEGGIIRKAENAPNLDKVPTKINIGMSTEKVGDVSKLPENWSWHEDDKDKPLEIDTPLEATAVYTGADKDNYENVSVKVTITRSSCEHDGEVLAAQGATAASCTADGYTGDECCAKCGEVLKHGEVIPKLGHLYDEEGEITKKATLTQKGEKTFKCSRCGEVETEETATAVYTTLSYKDNVITAEGDGCETKTITLDVDGGTIQEAYNPGSTAENGVTLPFGNTIAKAGCILLGWAVAQGGEDEYEASAGLADLFVSEDGTEKAEITLYAVWEDTVEGEIKIGKNKWNSFHANVSFDILTTKQEEITVTSEDAEKIYYLVATDGKTYTLKEVRGLAADSWTEYNPESKPKLASDTKNVVYVKMVSAEGNAGYISSEGIIEDETKPGASLSVVETSIKETELSFNVGSSEDGEFYFILAEDAEDGIKDAEDLSKAVADAAAAGKATTTGAATANKSVVVKVKDLKSGTAYNAYLVAEDIAGNLSDCERVSVQTKSEGNLPDKTETPQATVKPTVTDAPDVTEAPVETEKPAEETAKPTEPPAATQKPATPEAPKLDAVTYAEGLKLSSITLPADWAWVTPDQLLSAGTVKHKATYVPNGDVVEIELTVLKNPNPVYTAPTDLTGKSGEALSTVVLPAGWKWDNPEQVMDTDTTKYLAIYTDPSGNYMDAEVQLDVNVTDSSSTAKEKPQKNKVYTSANLKYKVTSTSAKTVTVVGPKSKTAKSLKINSKVKILGVSFKITAIDNSAFSGCNKLTSILIGSNVTQIGKNAFKNCSSLKKITIKATKLKSVGKSALKGINKKAVIKVPKKSYKAYKKLLKKKGQSSKVKIKK